MSGPRSASSVNQRDKIGGITYLKIEEAEKLDRASLFRKAFDQPFNPPFLARWRGQPSQ